MSLDLNLSLQLGDRCPPLELLRQINCAKLEVLWVSGSVNLSGDLHAELETYQKVILKLKFHQNLETQFQILIQARFFSL